MDSIHSFGTITAAGRTSTCFIAQLAVVSDRIDVPMKPIFAFLTARTVQDEVTGCWNWTGPRDKNGYGRTSYNGKSVRMNRLAAHYWFGHPLDSPLFVLHRCDNPSCVNPNHLFIGTVTDNNRDTVAKKRHRESRKTHCPKGHPYDEVNIYWQKSGSRQCRACHRDGATTDAKRKYHREQMAQKRRAMGIPMRNFATRPTQPMSLAEWKAASQRRATPD